MWCVVRRAAAVAAGLAFLLVSGALAAPAAAAALAVPAAAAPPPLDPAAPAAGWDGAARVNLGWDVHDQRPASEPAAARIEADDANLYVRFDVAQRETLLAQQHANDVGDGTDDEVWIDLWPNGSSGFYYQFAATSNGTHYQYSSENTAYAPTWTSFGRSDGDGFVVTMKIPLRVLRGSGNHGDWKVQFVRIVRSTGERQIWSYDPKQTDGDDVRYAGAVSGVRTAPALRPKPRLAVYGLGAAGSPASGLSTSRTGADLSIPVTATSSLFATLHPDFSNVEVDQQTISPTAFARSYSEVRPFFTQAANFYNNFDCGACPSVSSLYTPGIPTPRGGYAFEGKQGRLTFAGFDALGIGRSDGAAVMTWRSSDQKWRVSTQEVIANVGGISDHTNETGVSYNDGKHIDAFARYSSESGTDVLLGNQAQRYDTGLYYYTNTFGAGVSIRKIGADYHPVDGFVQHPDVAGYGAFENKIFLFGKDSPLNSVQVGTYLTRYQGTSGGPNQADSSAWIDVLTRNLIDVQLNVGSSYVRFDDGVFTPVSQNGLMVTWHSGSDNNPGNNENHGSSATPTTVMYNTGRFGPGRVDNWVRSTTMRAGMRGTFSLEVDDARDVLDQGPTGVLWLERLSYTRVLGPNMSFALGARKIVGTAPLLTLGAPPAYTNATNLSFAFHRRLPHDEVYFAYGDASRLTTVPQLILKLVHYFGAEKGS